MEKLYKPHTQKLYEYFGHRVKQELLDINAERQSEEQSLLSLSEGQVEEASQELLNYIVDSEEFLEEVTKIIIEKAEIEIH
jgi:hypothetical protein